MKKPQRFVFENVELGRFSIVRPGMAKIMRAYSVADRASAAIKEAVKAHNPRVGDSLRLQLKTGEIVLITREEQSNETNQD